MPSIKVIHIITSLRRGGRERQLATIYKYTDGEKAKTKIVCFNRSDDSYVDEYVMKNDILYLTKESLLGRLFELKKIIRTENPDIIWTWGGLEATFGILLSRFTHVKHINGSIRHGIVLKNKMQTWRMLMLHLSKNIVANSRAGLKANKIDRGYVMYNGLDEQFLNPPELSSAEVRRKLGIDDNVITLVSVANLVPYKDYPTVIRALSKIRKSGIRFNYIIIGDGPERPNIESLIKELDLTSEIMIPGKRTDVKDILHSANIFIHSSLGEGCSNAILEAMAAGLPVIASDTGGTAEIVDHTVGRLFEYRNADQLLTHITELTSSHELRKDLGAAAKDKAKSFFSIERMMEDYYRILNNVKGSKLYQHV
jgi:glycosyltransferase involved in cell wall biosynthesis